MQPRRTSSGRAWLALHHLGVLGQPRRGCGDQYSQSIQSSSFISAAQSDGNPYQSSGRTQRGRWARALDSLRRRRRTALSSGLQEVTNWFPR